MKQKIWKNTLENKTKNYNTTVIEKSLYCQALRHQNYLEKEQRTKLEAREMKDQEKVFKHSFYKFAKWITNDTHGKTPVEPTFSCAQANQFYKEKYSTAITVDPSELSWFPKVSPQKTVLSNRGNRVVRSCGFMVELGET